MTTSGAPTWRDTSTVTYDDSGRAVRCGPGRVVVAGPSHVTGAYLPVIWVGDTDSVLPDRAAGALGTLLYFVECFL